MWISQAFAQTASGGTQTEPNALLMQLPMIVMAVLLFYFVAIRPQTKRAKEQKAMIEALQKGDEIITSGGQLGRVLKVTDSYVVLEVDENIKVTVLKTAVQTLLPKGTLKTIEKE